MTLKHQRCHYASLRFAAICRIVPSAGNAGEEALMQHQRFAFLWSALSTFILVASISCATAFAEDRSEQNKSEQNKSETVWPTKEWQTSTPEEQGMNSAALARLLDFGTTLSFDSLLIARHGRIVLDAYYARRAADLPHAMNSATKAVIGTLAAIAYQDGLLDSLDHPALDFFGDRSVALDLLGGRSIADFDDKRKAKAITVQSLLDMTSGIDWTDPANGRLDTFTEMKRSPDWIRFILDRPMSTTPGEIFNYNSGNSHLVSAIITRLTGMSALDYAKAKLFGPLGIGVSYWGHDPQGITTGGNGLSMPPRDMAKIGYLYLRNGAWEDKKLLPPDWINRISHATVNTNLSGEPGMRYSNFFWALPDKHVYMAVGYHCQLIMVFSELDIVAVTTARDFCPLSKLADYISSAVKSEGALPSDPAGADLLANKIREISGRRLNDGPVPQVPEIVGHRQTFEPRLLASPIQLARAAEFGRQLETSSDSLR
jgi:CubicO group peptidase (beta-lactamase class C family)